MNSLGTKATRRHNWLLTFVPLALCLLVLAAAVSACGSKESTPPASSGSPAASSPASSSATLTIGMMGNTDETLDPHTPSSASAAELRNAQLYDGLTRLDPTGEVVWDLATDMTPNDDLTEWTVTLRPDVKCHDGTTFTADDVVFSVKRILDPKQQSGGAPLIASVVDPNGVTKVDDLTVKFALTKPYGPFKDVWSSRYLYMVPEGFDAASPVGTGPFVYESATPGQESTFTRFDDYWGGAAKFKTLRVVDFQDMNSIVNALKSGQIDVAGQIPLAQADSLASTPGIKVLSSEANFHIIIGVRTDLAPFDDVRVRNAVRLLVDRDQIVENAFNGQGSVGNDMFIRGTPGGYTPPDVPQRTQDIEEAKKLLAEAGQSNLTFSIATPGDMPGMMEMLQVIQENAKAAGVTVKINKMGIAAYLANWMKWPVSMDVGGNTYLFDVGNSLLKDAGGNIAHWNDPEFQSLADELFQTADHDKQLEIMQQMEKIHWERGGYLISAWSNVLIAHRDAVSGLVPAVYNLPVFYLQDVSVE